MKKCSSNFVSVSPLQAKAESALLVVGILLVVFLWPKGVGHDGSFRFASLDFLWRFGILDDFKFSLVGPLFASPLYWLGSLYKHPHWWVSRFNSFFFLFALWAFYRLLSPHLNRDLLRRFLLLLLVGSLFPKQIKEFYGEPFTQLLAALGLLALTLQKNFWGFGSLLVSGLNTAGTLIALTFSLTLRVWQSKSWRYLVVLPVIFLGVLLENWLRRGSPLLTGYEAEAPASLIYPSLPYTMGPGFSYPLALGILSVFFSFGKGLVFFTPGLFLFWGERRHYLPRFMRETSFLWWAYLWGLIFLYAQWFNWFGGGFWGPRFFLMASVIATFNLALFITSVRRGLAESLLLILVLALSIWVGWNGLVIDESLVGGLSNDFEANIWYVPEFSVLWRPFVVTPKLSINDYVFSAYFLLCFFCLAWPLVKQVKEQLKEFYPRITNGLRSLSNG